MVKFSKYFLFFAILMIPFYSIDFIATLLNFNIPYGVYIKAIKDISCLMLLFVFIMALIIKVTINKTINKTLAVYYIIFAYIFIVSFLVSYYNLGNLSFLLGYRALLPFLLFGFGFYFLSSDDLNKINTILNVILILLLLSFVFQFFVLRDIGLGLNSFGFTRRLTGFFFYPAPTSAFLILCAVFKKVNHQNEKFYWYILPLLLVVNSLTGLATWLAIPMLTKIKRSQLILAAIIFLPFLILLIYAYPLISNRDDFSLSILARFDALHKSLSKGMVFGNYIGYGGNFLLVLKQRGIYSGVPEDIYISDSEYASILGQFGIMGLLFYMVFMAYFIITGNKEQFVLIIFVAFVGFGTIWHEFFPVNFFVPMLLGYFERQKKDISIDQSLLAIMISHRKCGLKY